MKPEKIVCPTCEEPIRSNPDCELCVEMAKVTRFISDVIDIGLTVRMRILLEPGLELGATEIRLLEITDSFLNGYYEDPLPLPEKIQTVMDEVRKLQKKTAETLQKDDDSDKLN